MALEMWSIANAAGLVFLMAWIGLIIGFRQRLRQPRANRLFRWGLAWLLIACEVSLQVWYASTDSWDRYALPFQLCSMMVLLSAVQLMTRYSKLGDIVFFLGILGAMQAMLTPNLDYSYPSFRYFQFFAAHSAIIAACVFIAAVDRYRPTFKSVVNALIWLHVLAIPAAAANFLMGTNYMFLARKPSTASLLDVLAPWPWYLLQLELVAAGLCLILLVLMSLSKIFHLRRMDQ